MRRPIFIALLLTLPLLNACGGGSSEDSKVTQTRMDDIDSLKGTISDDMINTDESTDQAPLDAAAPEPAVKPAAKPDKKPAPAKPAPATVAPAAIPAATETE